MNRAQYKADIRSRLGKPLEDLSLQDRELDLRIKKARQGVASVLCRYDERLQKSQTWALGGSGLGAVFEEETMPTDFLVDLNVTNDGVTSTRVAYGDYTAVSSNSYYSPSAIDPLHYFYSQKIGFSPTSSSTNGILYYGATPTAFSDETTDEADLTAPFIPEEYQKLVVLEVCSSFDAKFNGEKQAELARIAQEKGYDIKRNAK